MVVRPFCEPCRSLLDTELNSVDGCKLQQCLLSFHPMQHSVPGIVLVNQNVVLCSPSPRQWPGARPWLDHIQAVAVAGFQTINAMCEGQHTPVSFGPFRLRAIVFTSEGGGDDEWMAGFDGEEAFLIAGATDVGKGQTFLTKGALFSLGTICEVCDDEVVLQEGQVGVQECTPGEDGEGTVGVGVDGDVKRGRGEGSEKW